mmetsp:Transcript_17058/g.30939  ORF Transcript_17058/g.30939 Transcript_17058/m.30939 type:complete len:1118 (+) Transcript_17058:283-3636(+)
MSDYSQFQESTAQIYTEPPMDITTEMMSPATTALLANMNVSIASDSAAAAAGSTNCSHHRPNNNNNNASMNSHDHGNDKSHHVDSSSSHHHAASNSIQMERRPPLGTIQNNTKEAAVTSKNKTNKNQTNTQRSRIMGPNETNYRTNHDSFVTKSIARYSARMSTNLRHESCLPDIHRMSARERSVALQQVDQLLERLSGVDAAINHSGRHQTSSSSAHSSSGQQHNHNNDETFGSATTLGDEGQQRQHDETFGSATTLGGENNHNSEGSGKRQSAGSANTTSGNNTTLASATTMGCNQSVSLLEESVILLSEDDEIGASGNDDDEEESSPTKHDKHRHCRKQERSPNAAPIEQTRHYQHPHHPSTSLALDDEMRSPMFTRTSKRCASNSGKRGLKTRHRSSNDYYADDDSLLLGIGQHFNGIGNGSGGDGNSGHMFLHDQEDVFSCGSPIARRFSNEYGVGESDCSGEESRDRLHDLPHHEHDKSGSGGTFYGNNKGKRTSANGNESSDGDSRFSLQDENENVSFNGGNDDYDDDDGDGGLGGNWNESQRPGTQNQLSQWNTFRNADADLTSTQMDDGENNNEHEESPVRRRAIRFDVTSQLLQSQRTSQQLSSGGDENRMADDDDDDMTEEDEHCKSSSSSKTKQTNKEDDPVQTVRNLCRRAKSLEEQGVDSSLLEEVAPIDVRLRDGVHFRMDPLRCRQDKEKSNSFKNRVSNKTKKKTVSIVHPRGKGKSKSKTGRAAAGARCESSSESEDSLSDPEPSFKDPISDFPSRVAARLNAGLSFLIEKEGDAAHTTSEEESEDREKSSAVLLSMTVRQIVCVTSKLLLQTIQSTRLHQRSKNGRPSSSAARRRYTPSSTNAPPKDDDYLTGGTLIVLRGKEDIAQWEVALREYTSLSCIDHAGMQSTLRKLANTAGKCAGFDVVLTTYDAIKSKEVTIAVDSAGCAILGSSGGGSSNKDDGWFSSRGGSGTQSGGVAAPQKCHQLSVLHRMSWFRVIFMDVLGRKGFLTKPGTARAQAAVAIHSKSRFAFFEKEEDAPIKVEEKFKDDRRQLRSIITVLQLPERMKLDKLIGSHILDVNQVGKVNEVNRLETSSSSSSDEDVSEKESIDDDLTDPW